MTPDVIGTSIAPVVPVPVTSVGAVAVTGYTATGERTSFVPPVQVRKPVAHCSAGADPFGDIEMHVRYQ